VGDGRATLTWTATSGASSYNVKYSTMSGGPYQTVAISVASQSFVHTGLNNNVTYYYVVSAQSSAGESGNSNQVSVKPVAAPVTTAIRVWWPTPGVTLSGTQPFKTLLTDWTLSNYQMYWRVDGDRLNLMRDSLVDAPHKEALVDVSTWKWRGKGPYDVEFVAQDLSGKTVAQTKLSIYVQ
jgi:hypothetical protein